MASSVIHTVRLPRLTSAVSYSGQFVTRYLALGIVWRRLSLNLLRNGSHQPRAASDRTATASILPSAPITTCRIKSTTYGLFAHRRETLDLAATDDRTPADRNAIY
jgi:hypothetical protein